MIKRFAGGIFLLIFLAACHTQKAIVKTTPEVFPVAPSPTENELARVMDSLKAQHEDITWLDAKAKISVTDGSKQTDFTANIRVKRDSILWFSISPALGIEVARVIIDKDSVKVIDHLNHRYEAEGFDYFKKYTSIPISFSEMQSVVLGSPLLLHHTDFTFLRNDSILLLARSDSSLSNEIHLLTNYLFSEQTLLNGSSGSLQMICSNYQAPVGQPAFAMWRKIELHHPSLVTISVNFTKAEFNKPQKFPFDPSKVQ